MTDLLDSRQAWVIAIASLLLIAVSGGVQYIAVVALKPIAAEFNWPRAIPALCYSLSMIGMGLGSLVMGRWSDRTGVALPITFGIIMIATGAWIASISQSKWELWLAHGVLIGLLGTSAFFAPLLANITRWFERRRGIAVAVVASGQALSGALWPPILRYFVDGYGWRATFTYFAIILLCLALPCVFFLRSRPPSLTVSNQPKSHHQVDEKVFAMSPNLALSLLSLAIIGCCVAMSMPMVHIVAHATDLGYSTVRAAEMLTVLLGCAFISRIIWGFIADHIGGLLTLLYGSLCQIVCLAGFTLVDSLIGLYIVAALFGLGYGGIVPSYTLIIREHFPLSGIGWRIGAIIFYGTVGMALGGWVGALIFDMSQSYAAAFLVGIAFNIGNLVIVALLVARQTQINRSSAVIS